jgi:arginyl-tRNA synthetase
MKFKVEESVFEKFPTLTVAIVIIKNFDNSKNREESVKILRNEEKILRKNFNVENLLKNKNIIAYLDTFNKFGVDPDKFLPAHLALSKRVLEGFDLPDINSAVNIYNALSIKYLTPFGGEDLKTLYGDFVLKFAEGGEQWIPIGGKKSKNAVSGELIWRDDLDVSTRALNWRQCDRTKLTDKSKNLFSIMDGFFDINKESIKIAADEFISTIEKYLGGKGSIYWIDKNQQSVEIPFKSKDIKTYKKITKTPETIKEKIYFGLAKEIKLNLKETLKKIGIKDLNIDYIVEHPANSDFGDYSTNVALTLTKQLKKNPFEIAEEIKNNFPKTDFIKKIDVIKPGFINFWLSSEYLLKEMNSFLQKKENLLKNDLYANKKVMVEYTDPNPFKEFHIGHLYSNTVGESIARIYGAIGADVKRADYFGDVGMHAAKSVWGLIEKMKKEKVSISDLEKKLLPERIKYLGQAYALGTINYEKDKKIAEEIKDINYLVYLCGQEYLKDHYHWKPQVNYQQYLRPEFMSQYKTVKEMYYAGKKWSLDYFEEIYKRLGTKFDYYYPESIVGEFGLKIVKENLKKGHFELSEGAVVFPGEKYGLHTRVFINSLGLPTYEAKELGLAVKKYEDFKYDKSIIVVGAEIKEYFKVLHKALLITYPELGEKTTNICTGMVKLPEGKMSSRTGNVITVAWMFDEIKIKLKEIMKNSKNVKDEELNDVVEIITVAAVKYSLLKNGIGQDIIFNFKESLALEGNSGPYLLYTYTRCQSVLKKASNYLSHDRGIDNINLNLDELNVLRFINQFPEIVQQAAIQLSPNLIANYLYELAQKYNYFYQKNKILESEENTKQFRLILTQAVGKIIKEGLYLLGIKTVEKM